MSKLNKKLALLKQQHQRLKLRLQSAKEEALKKGSANNQGVSSESSETNSNLSWSSLNRKGERLSHSRMHPIVTSMLMQETLSRARNLMPALKNWTSI